MKTTIIYEDNDILVVDKPAGIAVQSASSFGVDVESELRSYMAKTTGKPEIYVVHRLDQPVSGLLVFAKNKEAAAKLSKAVAGDGMSKIYHARVYGVPAKSEDTLTDYIKADKKAGIAKIVKMPGPGDKDVKKAVLSYKVLESGEKDSLLEVKLDTGRFHQIRVQLSNLGYPILGDRKYGSPESLTFSKEQGIMNICLRAVSLSFTHPRTSETVTFTGKE